MRSLHDEMADTGGSTSPQRQGQQRHDQDPRRVAEAPASSPAATRGVLDEIASGATAARWSGPDST